MHTALGCSHDINRKRRRISSSMGPFKLKSPFELHLLHSLRVFTLQCSLPVLYYFGSLPSLPVQVDSPLIITGHMFSNREGTQASWRAASRTDRLFAKSKASYYTLIYNCFLPITHVSLMPSQAKRISGEKNWFFQQNIKRYLWNRIFT